MKYFLLFAAMAVAIPKPWIHADLAYPQLERRLMRAKQGREGHKKMTVTVKQAVPQPPGTKRARPPDSPPREGDTHVSGTVKGPGRIGVFREKYHNTDHARDVYEATSGETRRKETHDAKWSEIEVNADGQPSGRAGSQPAVLHEARVQGSGQSGSVQVTPPSRGGYGKLKKEVNGVVVKDERIRPGQIGEDTHVGTRPGEVKYTASVSRGGEAYLSVNNLQSPST